MNYHITLFTESNNISSKLSQIWDPPTHKHTQALFLYITTGNAHKYNEVNTREICEVSLYLAGDSIEAVSFISKLVWPVLRS